jgi:hypothetical protein
MAHFAKLNEDNVIIEVIVIDNDDMNNLEFPESERIGQEFIKLLGLDGNWAQTSFSGSFRKKYGMVGDLFDEQNNVFISPKPYDSFTLDENFDWTPPFPMPDDGKRYCWVEEKMDWEEFIP